MVRTKSIAKRHVSYVLADLRSGWSELPYDVRRIVCEYYAPDADSFFIWLGSCIIRDDPDGYYYTGCIRLKMVLPDGTIEYRRYDPQDDANRRSIQSGVRIFRHAGDLQQCRLWLSYGKLIVGSRIGAVAQALDASSGRKTLKGSQYCRFDPSTNDTQQKDRSENQGVRTVSVSDCTTHTFQLGLVTRRIFPFHARMYESGQFKQCCSDLHSDGQGHGEGGNVRSINGRTHGVGCRTTDYIEGAISGSEEEYECDTECDGCFGEEEEGTIMPEYDGNDRLYFNQPIVRERYSYSRPSYWKPRVANAHLKSSRGVTIFEPLSWRVSIIPKWRSTSDSEYEQLCGYEGVVIGRRYTFLAELYQAASYYEESEFTVWYDNSPFTTSPCIPSIQYYHMGIVTSYYPQASFVELADNPLHVIIPLLEPLPSIYYGDYKKLQICQYTLKAGLKCRAVRICPLTPFESIVSHPDVRYV